MSPSIIIAACSKGTLGILAGTTSFIRLDQSGVNRLKTASSNSFDCSQ